MIWVQSNNSTSGLITHEYSPLSQCSSFVDTIVCKDHMNILYYLPAKMTTKHTV